MHPSERNGTSMVVRMDESSKSPTFDLEEHEEQAGGNFDAIQTPRGRLASKWFSSTPSPQNNHNEGMQPNLGVDGES